MTSVHLPLAGVEAAVRPEWKQVAADLLLQSLSTRLLLPFAIGVNDELHECSGAGNS
jgi:hypothetical protein